MLLCATGCTNTVIITDSDPCAGVSASSCPDQVRGICVGVASAPNCEPQRCDCSEIVTVDGSELSAALASATAGSCVEIGSGDYGDIDVPAGVTILGGGHLATSVGDVQLQSSAILCGVTATSVTVPDGATEAIVQSSLIEGSSSHGVSVGVGASAALSRSTVDGASEVGVYARDAAALVISRSIVANGNSFGVAAFCGDCVCPTEPTFEVRVRDSMIRGSRTAGAVFHGVAVDIRGVAIFDTDVGANFDAGAGMSVSCSSIEATGVTVAGSTDYGVGLFQSSGTMGAAGDGNGVRISDSLGGLWLIDISASSSQTIEIDNAVLFDNKAVGLGIAGPSGGGPVIIRDTTVRDTQLKALPILVGGVSAGSADVGDGLLWLHGVDVSLHDVTIDNSPRASVLIDGPATGLLDNVSLTGGDAALGILLQSYLGGAKPSTSGTTPSLTTSSQEVHPIPFSPQLQ
jgi:hypothetical protein